MDLAVLSICLSFFMMVKNGERSSKAGYDTAQKIAEKLESVRFISMGLQMNYKDAASDMVTFLFFDASVCLCFFDKIIS